MNHWIAAPLLLPPLVGAIMLISLRHHLVLARVFSVASLTFLLGISGWLLIESSTGLIQSYELGAWPSPFGIVLVLDRLSALMVALTAAIALATVLYSIGSGWDRRGRHFHALMQFQVLGLSGAFLTGDLFNLFVFFEVLLIASYGLMIHGAGKRRLKAGVQYVVYNLLGSTLFLFALGAIYAVTGTLNMADLAERVAAIPDGNTALIRVAAVLLLLVFAVKSALIPLHFWLPATYAEAPGPVAALFAIMTKVGAYAIIRVFTLIFGDSAPATENLAPGLVMPAAMLTLALGAIGVLGARTLGHMAAMATIGSVGTLLIAASAFTPAASAAALYYLIHSTLAGAMLFLVVDLVRSGREGGDDSLTPAPPVAQAGLVASLYFAAVIAAAGLPPFSGFIGKLLVLDALRPHPLAGAVWTLILLSSLVLLIGFARAGIMVFWQTRNPEAEETGPEPQSALSFAAVFGLLSAIVALTLLAQPVMDFLTATASQLHDPSPYIDQVLRRPGVPSP